MHFIFIKYYCMLIDATGGTMMRLDVGRVHHQELRLAPTASVAFMLGACPRMDIIAEGRHELQVLQCCFPPFAPSKYLILEAMLQSREKNRVFCEQV